MLLPDISLKKEDFDLCSWQEIVTGCEKRDCSYYESRFFKKANEAHELGDLRAQAVFVLLGAVSSFVLNLDSKEIPFGPMIVLERSRSAVPDDITDDQLALLKELVPSVADAELRARIADVLWLKKCGHEMAECAVTSYLESSKTLEEIVHWAPISDRIERAMQLAASLNSMNLLPKVVKHLESLLERCDNDRNQIPSLSLMRIARKNRKILAQYGQLDPLDYAELAERAAIRAENEKHWILAEQYWSIAAAWYVTQNAEKERDARIRAAETYVKQSEEALSNRDPPDYFVASIFLRKAIIAQRRIPLNEERVEELHKQLLQYEEESARAEKGTISIEIGREIQESMQRDMEHAKECVKEKKTDDALFALAFLAISPDVPTLQKTARDAMKEHPLLFLVPRVVLSDSGKVVALKATGGDDSSYKEAELLAEMFAQAQREQQYRVAFIIEPARRQIIQEHAVRLEDLRQLVMNNPFVPPGREYIFARGLYSGLMGDFLVSTHLLIPQLEHSIRWLLYQLGAVASTLEDRGIEQERNLNATLYEPFAAKLKKLLGENLVFDLRGLLVEDVGSNLRNTLAHGLIDSNFFFSEQLSYVWWITLHLCCLSLLNVEKRDKRELTPNECNDKKLNNAI